MQSSFTNELTALYEGQIAHSRRLADIHSKNVAETVGIKFGRFVALTAGNDSEVRALRSKTSTLTLSADLVTSNVLSGNVIINGVTTAYTETFASDHATTMAALVAELDALTGISAVLTSSRVITITADADYDAYFSTGAVTLGGSQATVTLSNTEPGVIYGVSVHEEYEPDSDGEVAVEDGHALSIGRQGYFAVRSDAALNIGDSIFVRFFEESAADKKRGMITSAAGSSPTKAIAYANGKVVRACAPGGYAVIRIKE